MPEADRTSRETKQPRRGLILVLCFFGLLLLLSLTGDRSLFELYRMAQIKADLERQIEVLTEENASLRQEVEAMRRFPSRAEEIARQDLGLVRPGEIVYQFRQR
jgi:cell division protein FtsB